MTASPGRPCREERAKSHPGPDLARLGAMTGTVAAPLPAAQIIDRVVAAVGVPPRPTGVDGIVAGDPATAVTGIAVTVAATLDVLQRAVAVGANLVVTHEPLYYDHTNAAVEALEAERDPVYLAKRDLIARHGLVVWRFHDQWHERRPDGVAEGTRRVLGWPDADGDGLYPVPATTLAQLAADIAGALRAEAARFVGDPDQPVRRVGLNLGFCGFEANRRALAQPGLDVLVVGEGHEWELGEYVADSVTLAADGHGPAKGLVVVGHYPSEESGQVLLSEWLSELLPGVPVTLVRAGDPYLRA